MIYIENKDGVQRVVIPTNDTNVEYVNFVPQEGDSNYYTKTQTDERITQSRTDVLGEVGDWLSHYPTTDQMHDAIENVTVDLTGYATEDWVKEQGYATKQYVDDAVADIPTGGGVEVNIESLKLGNAAINGSAFDRLFASYSQGIPSYIFDTDTKAVMPVVGAVEDPVNGTGIGSILYVLNKDVLIQYKRANLLDIQRALRTDIPLGDSADLSDYYTKGEIDTVKDDLQTQITDNHNSIIGLDSRVKDIELNGGGGIEPFIVEVDSIEPITKTVFDQLFESYSQGIPSYIRKTGLPEQLIPVIGIQGTITGTIMPVARMWVIINNNLIEYIRTSSPGIGFTIIPLGGSGDGAGVKVYEGMHVENAGQGGFQFTNQMVYDMFKDYHNGLRVQVQMGDLCNVYYASDASPRYRVYMLAGNIIGKLEGDINYPSEYATFSEYILVTDDVFDKAIPHKYDYTITDDIALTGSFTEGEGYALFNDVKDGIDINFKLIMNGGQKRVMLSSYEYDSYMNRANFWFLDMGEYILSCTMEYDGSMTINRIEP